MIRIRYGKVLKVLKEGPQVQELLVLVEEEEAKAVNYVSLLGTMQEGDYVVLNTTALYKSLGTGGLHFVMAKEEMRSSGGRGKDAGESGHIMKLRYTPGQIKCLAVEEEDSPFHGKLKDLRSVSGLPVVVSTLHSMLPLIIAGVRTVNPKIKIAFIMTDGAALPLWFSNMLVNLKNMGWIDRTITVGHAFGGDLEAVNIYTGLTAAKAVAEADIAIVGMGPGIVGTGTALGYTGVEQGEIINAVNILEGQAIAVPRISFADPRPRHRGLSHHSMTALGRIALTSAKVVLHKMEPQKFELVEQQITESGIGNKHEIVVEDGAAAVKMIKEVGIRVTTMGRNIDQDPEFFLTCGAAGMVAARLV